MTKTLKMAPNIALKMDPRITLTADLLVAVDGDALVAAANGLRVRAILEGTRIVFTGGAKGVHSIEADESISSAARVRAHWLGYCENNGVTGAAS